MLSPIFPRALAFYFALALSLQLTSAADDSLQKRLVGTSLRKPVPKLTGEAVGHVLLDIHTGTQGHETGMRR